MESKNKTKNKNVTIIKEKNEIKNLYQKFSKFSKKELNQITIKKSKELIDINKKKEEAKNNLNIIVQKLNELIQSNSRILNIGEPDPEIIEKLEKILEIRKRDLVFSIKLKENYKKQYENINMSTSEIKEFYTIEPKKEFVSGLEIIGNKISSKIESRERIKRDLLDLKNNNEVDFSLIKPLGELKENTCVFEYDKKAYGIAGCYISIAKELSCDELLLGNNKFKTIIRNMAIDSNGIAKEVVEEFHKSLNTNKKIK